MVSCRNAQNHMAAAKQASHVRNHCPLLMCILLLCCSSGTISKNLFRLRDCVLHNQSIGVTFSQHEMTGDATPNPA